MMTSASAIGRNQPCPCGSGRRYKQCCGGGPFGRHTGALYAALARQQEGDLAAAEEIYQRVLEEAPDLPDASHMLGVVRLAQGRAAEATALIRRAGQLTKWELEPIRHNFGLALGARLLGRSAGHDAPMREAWLRWRAETAAAPSGADPLVTIVMPAYNHERYVEAALESVFAQDYRRIELIVIDDGSTDSTARRVRDKLAACPFPHTFTARENRGARVTLEEAIAAAHGEYVNPLNSDDCFEPARIARMVDAVARRGLAWGFAEVVPIDDAGTPLAGAHQLAAELGSAVAALRVPGPAGPTLVAYNATISSGNLFFAKSLHARLGGFREFRYNHDWDFVLRALWLAEPAFVAEPLYRYRLHGSNTINESRRRAKGEADEILADYHRRARSEPPRNPFAPSRATLGIGHLARPLADGQGVALTARELMEIDDEINALDAAVGRGVSGQRSVE